MPDARRTAAVGWTIAVLLPFLIRDLESADGTYVNGARIRYVELRSRDRIGAGNTLLLFRILGDEGELE